MFIEMKGTMNNRKLNCRYSKRYCLLFIQAL